jgi:hypothetical protein
LAIAAFSKHAFSPIWGAKRNKLLGRQILKKLRLFQNAPYGVSFGTASYP